MFDELNISITNDEIRRAIKQLRIGASAGPDLLLNEFLKNGSTELLTYIYNLFNRIF